MTSTQRHFYRALLQAAYYVNTRPNLPADDNELCVLADAEDLAHWLSNKRPVLAKFLPVTGPNGEQLLSHKRVQADWDQVLDYVAKKSKAGKAGKHQGSTAQHMTSRVHKTETETETVTGNLNTKGKETVTEPVTTNGSVSFPGLALPVVSDALSDSGFTEQLGDGLSVPVYLGYAWTKLYGSKADPTDFERIINASYAGDTAAARAEIPSVLTWAATTSSYWKPELLPDTGALSSSFATIRGQWSRYMEKVHQGNEKKQMATRLLRSPKTENAEVEMVNPLDEDEDFASVVILDEEEID